MASAARGDPGPFIRHAAAAGRRFKPRLEGLRAAKSACADWDEIESVKTPWGIDRFARHAERVRLGQGASLAQSRRISALVASSAPSVPAASTRPSLSTMM